MSTPDLTTTTPFLTPNPSTATSDRSFRSQSRRFSRRVGLRGAARFLRRANTDQSVRVREVAAQQIEDRQSDWAYSTPIVVLDLLWNVVFVFVAIFMILLSSDEVTHVPLRLWIVGYGIQCVLHMVCVCFEFKRRREARYGSGLGSGFRLELNESNSRLNESNLRLNSSSDASIDIGNVDFGSEMRRVDDDNTSVAKHLESVNTMFSFIWWIIGFYWVSSGGEILENDAPKLYWLTITFLAFDVFFVVICVAVACIIGIAVCCCLPCIIAILYAVADQEGATREDIERLPRYKFNRTGGSEKRNGEIQESVGGIMIECDSDTPIEHVLSAEDAECCICLTSYDDGNELRELPCRHHFHSACIDKWLHINATCPLCKYNILKNGNLSGDEV